MLAFLISFQPKLNPLEANNTSLLINHSHHFIYLAIPPNEISPRYTIKNNTYSKPQIISNSQSKKKSIVIPKIRTFSSYSAIPSVYPSYYSDSCQINQNTCIQSAFQTEENKLIVKGATDSDPDRAKGLNWISRDGAASYRLVEVRVAVIFFSCQERTRFQSDTTRTRKFGAGWQRRRRRWGCRERELRESREREMKAEFLYFF